MPLSLQKISRKKKRIGRGIGSRGAKSGRGMKGQKARAGYSSKAGFEGGQTPLYMRLPKGRGTKQASAPQKRERIAVTVTALGSFAAGEIVGPGALRKAGMLPRHRVEVKLIGNEALKSALTIRVHAASAGARKSVETAGGKIELIEHA